MCIWTFVGKIQKTAGYICLQYFKAGDAFFLDEDLEVCALMDWDSTNKTLNVNISYLIFSFCLNTDLLTH